MGQRERCHCTVVAREASGYLIGPMPSGQMALTVHDDELIWAFTAPLAQLLVVDCPLEGSTALDRSIGPAVRIAQQ